MRRVVQRGEVPIILRASDAATVVRKVGPRRYVNAVLVDCEPGELVYIATDSVPGCRREDTSVAWVPVTIERRT